MDLRIRSNHLLDIAWKSGEDTATINGYTEVTIEHMEDMIKTLQSMIDAIQADKFDRDYTAAQITD